MRKGCYSEELVKAMTSSAFWVRSEASSANDNHPCSEALHHGNSDSRVVMFCVNVPVHGELED